MSENKKYRLVTRSDFDGLVCAVLFKELDMIEEEEHFEEMEEFLEMFESDTIH